MSLFCYINTNLCFSLEIFFKHFAKYFRFRFRKGLFVPYIVAKITLKTESKKIIIYNDTTEITFNSISSCIKDFFNVVQYNNKKEFDKIRSGIRDVLSTKRKQKTYKGYKFIYV